MAAREALQADGIGTAVVSMPCQELFDAQDEAYRQSVLGPENIRVAVEAAVKLDGTAIAGPKGGFVGMDGFGRRRQRANSIKHFGTRHRRSKPPSGNEYKETKNGSACGNGFGRIGRLVMRAAIESGREDIEFVGINDLGDTKSNAHLLKYDTVHGKLDTEISTGDDWMDFGKGKIKVTAERDPAKLPWKELDVDIAMECTGIFTDKESASKHLDAGAKRVLVSAPASGADLTLVYGINHDQLDPSHTVVSNASCTTNCLAPVAYVLNQAIGIERGYMTTVHAFTGDQRTTDTLHSDMRAHGRRRNR